MLKLFFLAGGWLSLGLGVAGAFLPLLPTTPFLLLSMFCFARSSPATREWLLNHPWLGPYVRDWELHRGVRRSVKVLAVAAVLSLVATTWLLSSDSSATLRWSITAFASLGLTVVWRLPVINANSTKTLPAPDPVGSDVAA